MGNTGSSYGETVSQEDGAMGHQLSTKAATEQHIALYDVHVGGQDFQHCGPRGQCGGIVGGPVTYSCNSYHQDAATMVATQDPPFMYEKRELYNYRATNNQRMVPGTCGPPPEPNQRICYYGCN